MAIIRFTDCKLCDEGQVVEQDLYVNTESGKIVDPSFNVDKVIDLHGLILTPGFIDIQINGCFGFDFSHYATDEEYLTGYDKCLKKLVKTGTTSLCPTMITSTSKNYSKILPFLEGQKRNDRTESLGAHCEGPIISRKKKGCHDPRNLKTPKNKKEFYEVYGGRQNFQYMKIITAAPELDGFLDLIPEITGNSVVYSIGHTTATFEQSLAAVKNGATMITHMFNAMPQPHHRNPGPIGLEGLEDEGMCPYFGLISDGIHIHPTYINLIYNANKERCCLVTDAMNLIGLPDGEYPWEDRFIIKSGRSLILKGTDTIAGSATEQAKCMRNLREWCDISLPEAVKCVTNNPAKSVHVDDHKGFLRIGYDADLCVLDKHGNVKQVFKLGNKVYDMKEETVKGRL
ncbi:DEKNAAC100317 [Brettanomyces naardenensis]|uniref:N-acetylglucosamine-6-phosphate deacetylase n=1 Tax=Brettanomyces naardenensis TaxID=13370 RepID=A0A448YG86_BRENA|nr:DEKNAAC100317 [Brettanomyces naardenensis]